MHRTRNSASHVRSRNVLSEKSMFIGLFWIASLGRSRPVPSRFRQLGSKMVAGRCYDVPFRAISTSAKLQRNEEEILCGQEIRYEGPGGGLHVGPGGGLYVGSRGGASVGSGDGLSVGSGGGLSVGQGGGLSVGPGGGMSVRPKPGGGLSVGPGGGLYAGPCSTPYTSNWPPIEHLLQELKNRNMMQQYYLIGRAHGLIR
jgi:hypothetical protein